MADARRLRRIESAIQQIVAPLVAHGLQDPRLAMVTVTRVRVSPDLSVAHVNWTCLGGPGARSKAAHALEHARGRLQSAAARGLRTRTTPKLVFHYDEKLEQAFRVQAILDDLERQRRAQAPPEPESPGETGDDG